MLIKKQKFTLIYYLMLKYSSNSRIIKYISIKTMAIKVIGKEVQNVSHRHDKKSAFH